MPEKIGRVQLVAEGQKTLWQTRRQIYGAEVEETPTATGQRVFLKNTDGVQKDIPMFLLSYMANNK